MVVMQSFVYHRLCGQSPVTESKGSVGKTEVWVV